LIITDIFKFFYSCFRKKLSSFPLPGELSPLTGKTLDRPVIVGCR